MEVICINNKSWVNSLTVGNEYEVVGEDKDVYQIKDNTGKVYNYFKGRFKPSAPKYLVNTSNDKNDTGFGDSPQAYALYVKNGKVLTDGYIYNDWRDGGYTHMGDLHELLREIVRQYPDYLQKLNKHLTEPIVL